MSESRKYLARANEILALMQEEKINTSCKGANARKIDLVRTLTVNATKDVIAPGLTALVATTLLKVGLCKELSVRFIIEYCIKFQDPEVSIIILSNPSRSLSKEDHAAVYVGPITVPVNLTTGKDHSSVTISPQDANQSLLEEFIKANQDGVFADPLLNCVGTSKESLAPLMEYCKQYDITHVIAIGPYKNAPNFVENAVTIKNNAVKISEELKTSPQLNNSVQSTVKPPQPTDNIESTPFVGEFREIKYKESETGYLSRLQKILGNDIVKISHTHSVLFPVAWLSQLGDTAIQELSSKLGMEEDKLRVKK